MEGHGELFSRYFFMSVLVSSAVFDMPCPADEMSLPAPETVSQAAVKASAKIAIAGAAMLRSFFWIMLISRFKSKSAQTGQHARRARVP